MLISLNLVIISKCMCILNRYIIHLKYIQLLIVKKSKISNSRISNLGFVKQEDQHLYVCIYLYMKNQLLKMFKYKLLLKVSYSIFIYLFLELHF